MEMPERLSIEVMAIYTAGFFDGEGCCGLYLSKGHYKPVITITNTNRFVLYSIQRSISLGEVYNKTGGKANWKAAYQLQFPRDHMAKFCKLILPYVILKKRQVELMLQFLDTTDEQVTQREAIRQELSALNSRGC